MRRLFVVFILLFFIGYINAQVIENPVFDRSDVPEFHVEKVVITQDTTYVYCSSQVTVGEASISKDMYLEDVSNGTRFPLLKTLGLPISPGKREFTNNGNIQVILYFPHINTSKFNIIEDYIKIYGINLSESYSTKYEHSDYKRFQNLSDFYLSANNESKYLEFEEKELQAAQYLYGIKSIFALLCYQQLSSLYDNVGDYSRAIDLNLLLLECDSIHYGVDNCEYPMYPMDLHKISRIYLNAGMDTESLQYSKKSIDVFRNMGNADKYLNEVYNIVMDAPHGHDSVRFVKRIEIVQKELDNLPSSVNDTTSFIATIQKHMAIGFFIFNDFRNAISYCDKAMVTLKKIGKESSGEFAEILGLKCKYQVQQPHTQYYEAITTGEEAKKLFEFLNIKSFEYADLLEDLARAYSWLLNYEKAIQLEKKATLVFEFAKDWIALANAYNNIGNYYQESEDLDNAVFFIIKAVEVLDNHDDTMEYLPAKEELFGNSVIDNTFLLNKLNERIFYGKIHSRETLAKIYIKKKKLADAINTEKEVVNICKNMEDDFWLAKCLLTLSEYYIEDKQFDNAISCVEQSSQILEKEDGKNIRDILYPMLAKIYYKSGDLEKAILYINKSLPMLKNDINIKAPVISGLACMYWLNHNIKESESILSELLDILKDKICNEIAGMTNEQRQRMWDKYEHNFLLYRNVVKELDNNEAYLSKLYDYVLFSKSFMLYTGISQNSDHLSRLNNTWKDIQNVLSEDDIAIEFIATTQEEHEGFTYNALVVDKHCQNPQMIELYSDYDTEMDINTLGEKVWGPILYKYKNARNIFFSADFFFHAFPIEYLIVDGYGLMFEKFNLYRLSSTKEILQKKGKNEKGQAVIYGGLEYNQMADFALEEKTGTLPGMLRSISERGGFEPLYNTLDEVNNIRDLLSSQNIATTLYVGNEGTEESFRKLSGMNVHILHLATHGMYIEPENVSLEKHRQNFDFLESLNNENNPVKEDVTLTHSFLVLSGGNKLIQHNKVLGDDDGILTAKEISETDLKGIDLVVLSACESALGDTNSNGVCGLQRGFKKAGVNTILMSATKVDDEATRILMVEFYKNLMSGNSKLQSLRNAQRYLRGYDNNKYIDYKYWGSFFLLDALN